MSERYRILETKTAVVKFTGGSDTSDDGHEDSMDSELNSEHNDAEHVERSFFHRFNPFNTGLSDSGWLSGTTGQSVLMENHYSLPEELLTEAELKAKITELKLDVLQTDNTERRKELTAKLIDYRLQLSELNFSKGSPVIPDKADSHQVRRVLGHTFLPGTGDENNYYCDRCNGLVLLPWLSLQDWYYCTLCQYRCHGKCLMQVTRQCASEAVAENPMYLLAICPEKGLSAQNMKCAECKCTIGFESSQTEARRCDYNGLYYCPMCHWNDATVMPARALQDWDLEPRKVSRAAKQYIKLMQCKPVLRIQDISPWLFSFVEELLQIKKLREEILVMKKYFLSCQAALKSKLLLQLKARQHFVENSDMYSMQDILDTASDKLLPELAKIHTSFAQHIKTDCESCKGKGFVCELCNDKEVLFPFDNHAVVCPNCANVLHRHCYVRSTNRCPRCERIESRSNVTHSNSDESNSEQSSPFHTDFRGKT